MSTRTPHEFCFDQRREETAVMSGYALVPFYLLGLTFMVVAGVFRHRFRRLLKRGVRYLDRLHRRSRGDKSTLWGGLIRWTIVGVGGLLFLVGVPLIPLPGPGWLTVLLGLGLLSFEFSWASRLLRYIRDTFLRLLDHVPGSGFVRTFLRKQSTSPARGEDSPEQLP